MRTRFIVGIAIAAIIAAVALVQARRQPHVPVSDTAIRTRIEAQRANRRANVRRAIAAQIAVAPNATSAPTADTLGWSQPFSSIEPRLRRLAADGDVDAAYALGDRGAQCLTTLREKTRAQLLAEMAEEDATLARDDVDRDLRELRRLNTDSRPRFDLARYDACAAVGVARLADSILWLERAGRAGNPRAQVAFARHAFDEWPTKEMLVAHVEEAARRRSLARTWIGTLIAHGDENALVLYVDTLEGRGPLYPRDARNAATYGYVLELLRERRVGRFEQRWNEGPYVNPREFNASQRAQVWSDGRRIYQQWFKDTPLYPR